MAAKHKLNHYSAAMVAEYSRAQLAEKLTAMGYPVSDETIYRWEKAGKIAKPKKLRRNGRLLYTHEHLEATIKFMQQTD